MEVGGYGDERMWRWEDVEAGGCGDVGETMEESCFFIRQIYTHTLKTYIHTHTHTHYTHSPSHLLPLSSSSLSQHPSGHLHSGWFPEWGRQPLLLKTVVWS